MERDAKNAKGMGRKMKWIENKWKQWSASKRIICLLFIGTMVILGMTVGLRVWDRSRQKPRVLVALKQLAKEASEQKYSLAPLIQIIQEGNIEQEGYVNFDVWNQVVQGLDLIWLKQVDMTDSSIRYQLALQQKEGIYSGEAEYQIAELGVLKIENYLTKEKLITRIPQIHNSYLRMDTKDLKNQYKDSLLYGVLGEKLVVPESDLSIASVPVFPQENELKKMDLIPAFLEEYGERLVELWQQISVKKERETKQVLINGIYENCSVFHLSLPMELVQCYLDYLWPDTMEKQWQLIAKENETVDLLLYMDDENHIHQIETVIKPEIEGRIYSTEVFCYLKGEEFLLDKVQVDLYIEQQEEEWGLRMDLEKQLEETKRKIYFSICQIYPEQIEQIRANLIMDTITGESDIEYKINLPFLASDGEHKIRTLEESIQAPEGEMIDIFELDLIEFLKFSRDFNFALFR